MSSTHVPATRGAARAALLLLLAAALLAPAQADAARRRFRRMVVVGDSVLAGFGSGGLVGSGTTGQSDSASALVARQAGRSLPLPLMSGPGLPPPFQIDDANGNGVLDRGEVRRPTDKLGFRKSTHTMARNLAVPGENVDSVFAALRAGDVARRLVTNDIGGRDILKFVILGFPLRDRPVSQLTRTRDLHPSFIMAWLGNNDVLPMATRTSPQAVNLTPAEFGQRYLTFLNRLADSRVGIAVANLPDVTRIAALRKPGDTVTGCHRDDGTEQTLGADDLLPITLDPAELPVPPCSHVLDSAEQAFVRTTVMDFNAQIDAAILQVEQQRGVPIARVDMFTLFDDLAQRGYDVRGDGTLVLTTGYLGGIFSLDGVHPTRTGHALIANAFIDAINARFGETLPRVDVASIAQNDPLVDNAFQPQGQVPFGVIADQNVDLGDALDDAFSNVADQTGDLLRDFRRRARNFFHRIF